MKAMKSMSMNRVLGSLKRKPGSTEESIVDDGADTPEASAARNVRLFAESGSGGPDGGGDEVLYLPAIVDAAESSPEAARQCAASIRKYLKTENCARPSVQYNSIMLLRILADNPGPTFTRNLDAKFTQTVKELLRVGNDQGVRQLLMETLNTFERERTGDETLELLIEMWKKEQARNLKYTAPGLGSRTVYVPPLNGTQNRDPHSQNYFSRNHHVRKLPTPQELAARIEEARNSAQLLTQVVSSTPLPEVLGNELIREFADRCTSASRSIQAYMVCEAPAPDNNTMETLIEINEKLAAAINAHQRAVLKARKTMGLGGDMTPPSTQSPRHESFTPPPGAPPQQRTNSGYAAPPPIPASSRPQAAASTSAAEDLYSDNPFEDPGESSAPKPPFPTDVKSELTGQFNDHSGVEPYHPGFKETPSYVGRQDSAVGGVKMSPAVVKEEAPAAGDRVTNGKGKGREEEGVSRSGSKGSTAGSVARSGSKGSSRWQYTGREWKSLEKEGEAGSVEKEK